MSEQEFFTLQDVYDTFVPSIAYQVYRRYREHVSARRVGVAAWAWADSHEAKIEGLLAKSPQRVRQVRQGIEDACRVYCEKQKAKQLGYSLDDVYWYTPGVVSELLPMAMNPAWKPTDETLEQDGKPKRSKPAREGNDLLAMVLDVRRAYEKVGSDPSAIVDFLGGRRPKGLAA